MTRPILLTKHDERSWKGENEEEYYDQDDFEKLTDPNNNDKSRTQNNINQEDEEPQLISEE